MANAGREASREASREAGREAGREATPNYPTQAGSNPSAHPDPNRPTQAGPAHARPVTHTVTWVVLPMFCMVLNILT